MSARKPTAAQLRRMEWGRKAINLDLTTGRDRGTPIHWPVQTGGWVTQDGPADGQPCGQGLHAALSVAGLSSAHRLAEAIIVPVGWLPEDVLGRDDDKVRVRRLFVLPCPVSFPAMLRDGWGQGADLGDANLRDANLRDANLRDANLRDANLRDANLWGANLWGADLRGADLGGANLGGANLGGANLGGANLRGANLWGANLRGADLGGANLGGANLGGANLWGANLWGANLRGANLWGANLRGANLGGANLRGANLGGAVADRRTRWPDGYDFRTAGVTVR